MQAARQAAARGAQAPRGPAGPRLACPRDRAPAHRTASRAEDGGTSPRRGGLAGRGRPSPQPRTPSREEKWLKGGGRAGGEGGGKEGGRRGQRGEGRRGGEVRRARKRKRGIGEGPRKAPHGGSRGPQDGSKRLPRAPRRLRRAPRRLILLILLLLVFLLILCIILLPTPPSIHPVSFSSSLPPRTARRSHALLPHY